MDIARIRKHMVYSKTRQVVYVQESYANLGASLFAKFSLQRNNLGNFESTWQAFIVTYSYVLLNFPQFYRRRAIFAFQKLYCWCGFSKGMNNLTAFDFDNNGVYNKLNS